MTFHYAALVWTIAEVALLVQASDDHIFLVQALAELQHFVQALENSAFHVQASDNHMFPVQALAELEHFVQALDDHIFLVVHLVCFEAFQVHLEGYLACLNPVQFLAM